MLRRSAPPDGGFDLTPHGRAIAAKPTRFGRAFGEMGSAVLAFFRNRPIQQGKEGSQHAPSYNADCEVFNERKDECRNKDDCLAPTP